MQQRSLPLQVNSAHSTHSNHQHACSLTKLIPVLNTQNYVYSAVLLVKESTGTQAASSGNRSQTPLAQRRASYTLDHNNII